MHRNGRDIELVKLVSCVSLSFPVESSQTNEISFSRYEYEWFILRNDKCARELRTQTFLLETRTLANIFFKHYFYIKMDSFSFILKYYIFVEYLHHLET